MILSNNTPFISKIILRRVDLSSSESCIIDEKLGDLAAIQFATINFCTNTKELIVSR